VRWEIVPRHAVARAGDRTYSAHVRRVTLLPLLALLLVPVTAQAANVDVQVGPGGYDTFQPSSVTVAPGDTVTWRWVSGSHSVTSNPNQAESFESHPGQPFPASPPGSTFQHRFSAAGQTIRYFCRVHGGMTGQVMVTGGGGGGDVTAPRVSSLKVRPSKVCRRKSDKCRKPGAKFSFNLSEPGRVALTITRRSNGKVVKTSSFNGKQGANERKLSTKGLKAGRYRLSITATDANGNASTVATKSFSVR
jgi:plastocyanin